MVFWNRLISFRKESESENAFADRIGVPRETLRSWRKGYAPKWETLQEPADKLGTTVLWLLTGVGPRDKKTFDSYMVKFADGIRKGGKADVS